MNDNEIMEFHYQTEIQLDKKMYIDSRLKVKRIEFEEGTYDKSNKLQSMIADNNAKILAYRKQKASFRYFMISVNTDIVDLPSLDLIENLRTQVIKFVRRKICSSAIYNFEFHTKRGGHLHAHILVDNMNTNSVAEFKRNAKSTFSKVINLDVDNPKQLHISGIPNANVLSKYNYIMGVKQKGKQPLVEMDREWRENIGLEHYILVSEFDFEEVGPQVDAESSDSDE